ncbi:M23 family metallopeptidase [Megamonas hypermegale]|uniref:Peptidoglycan DD-metalloendopeptidase family protein n=1 Tax=Megamonas hypermegale TaxID=158847 RepID=A0A921L8K8_9FIRM|nr:M23 family metallopeptidase [Megamonas hypermegale]MDM8142449.1 peptidoglycan DD-metalloendopeptidase family protein [Megamonas hypermegale]HJF85677.1 peptidoglycan DD-metalloendopeptidase family protein [Megamonas hypermegale]
MSQEEEKQHSTEQDNAETAKQAKTVEKVQNNSYTVRIIPDKTDDIKLFTVTKSMVKYLLASVVILLVLVVGSLGFAGYAYINNQSDKEHIRQLQEANTIQQQQLSELDKKANSLQEDMDQLINLENELKQLSGIEINDDNTADENVNTQQNGQGGPYPQPPTIADVRATLNNIESKMSGQRNNMQQLKLELQKAIVMKRQQIAISNQTISVTPSIWPSQGVVSSPYGLRWGGSDFHPGIDIANDMGTPIRATADGTVSVAGWNSGGYGNMVDIDHGNGVMTRYGHASYVVVTAGQHVKRGQIIAYMGSTGFSTGPHVHYEVRINGQAVDPSGYLFN